jgi:phage shock protein A
MASLLEKVQVLVSADLNRLVDRALQSNEPAVFQHHIRELQNLQEQLAEQLAGVKADITLMRRRSDEAQTLVVQQDQAVDGLLQAGLQEEALAAQDRLNQARLTAAKLTEQVERLEAQYAGLTEGKTRLDARVTALQQTEPEVGNLVSLARAKEATATTAQSLEDLAGTGDQDAARVVDSIRRRLAEAEAKMQALEQSGLAHGETPEVLKRKELESQLEARKARLGL